MTEIDRKDFFISYTKADQAHAEWVADQLEIAGYTTIIQAWDFRPGDNFVLAMQDATQRAMTTLLILSDSYLQSGYAAAEWAAAFRFDPTGNKRKIIPVKVGACSPEGLLGPIIYIDLYGLSPNEATQTLLEGVKSGRSKPKDSVPFPREPLKGERASNSGQTNPTDDRTSPSADEAERVKLEYSEYIATAYWLRDARIFFEDRLSEAFPGVRGLQIYQGNDALARLEILLKSPLTIQRGNAKKPLWWWRGGSELDFDSFRILDKARLWCLMSNYELLVNTVAVFRTNRNYRSFVYVLVDADQPTGVYPITDVQISDQVREWGHSEETVGFWNGHYIKGEEYDDGYAEIDGKIVRVSGARRRTRYLSPYNFFISAQASVFCPAENDTEVNKLCRRLLGGEIKLEEAVGVLNSLPLSGRLASYLSWME